jgi:hypothetical protein
MENFDDLEITKEDFIELSRYTYKIESERNQLLEQLKEAKSMLAATVQQRNSLNAKLQTLVSERINTIDVSAIKTNVVNTNIELINPEQYREKANQR